MSDATGSNRLLFAVRQLLPDAAMSVTLERPWHSLTFAGTQLCLTAIVCEENHAQDARVFAARLPEYEFTLENSLVADIAVIESVTGDAETRLTISALLLDD
jgi:hypothetical protein